MPRSFSGALALLANDEWTFLEKTEEEGDEWVGKLVIPETDQLIVYGKWEGQDQYNGIMAYEIEKRSRKVIGRLP